MNLCLKFNCCSIQKKLCLISEVKKIAPEFYDTLPYHTSWSKVIYDFITDPAIGPYARIKRQTLKGKEEKAK